MKSLLIIIFSFLFIMTSCNQANNNSGQIEQSPIKSSSQKNIMKADTLPTQPADAEKVTETSGEQKDEVVMLNPPHGQPNHRCDIAIGAPLNSAPATKTTTSNKSNTPVQANGAQVASQAAGAANNSFSPTVENAAKLNNPQMQRTSTTSTANTGPKPATNPAHGQPHHRCDIPVGSTLP